MQVDQYVSTIANDGYRVKPHIVKDIHNPSVDKDLGSIYKSNETEVLNKMKIKDSELKRIQEGFRGAFQSEGGTGYSYWSGKNYNPAGKTGDRKSTRLNSSHVAISYAVFCLQKKILLNRHVLDNI